MTCLRMRDCVTAQGAGQACPGASPGATVMSPAGVGRAMAPRAGVGVGTVDRKMGVLRKPLSPAFPGAPQQSGRPLCWPRWMDRRADAWTDRCPGRCSGEEPRLPLTSSPSPRQRLPGVPGQRQLGRARQLLRVPGDPQRGGEAGRAGQAQPRCAPAPWLRGRGATAQASPREGLWSGRWAAMSWDLPSSLPPASLPPFPPPAPAGTGSHPFPAPPPERHPCRSSQRPLSESGMGVRESRDVGKSLAEPLNISVWGKVLLTHNTEFKGADGETAHPRHWVPSPEAAVCPLRGCFPETSFWCASHYVHGNFPVLPNVAHGTPCSTPCFFSYNYPSGRLHSFSHLHSITSRRRTLISLLSLYCQSSVISNSATRNNLGRGTLADARVYLASWCCCSVPPVPSPTSPHPPLP